MGEELFKLLQTIIEIPSLFPKEGVLSAYLYSFFKQYPGCTVFRQRVENGRYNIIVEKGKGKKVICLYAHLDTISITQGWKTDPLKLTIKGDKAYGLGAFDMKAGAVANIEAFLSYSPLHIKTKLIFCIDEENISKGAFTLLNAGYIDDVDCFISTEPALQYGQQGIVTGRIGRAVFEICLERDSTHFIHYIPTKDLHLLAADIIAKLQILYKEHNNKRQFIFVRKMYSEANGMSLPEKIFIELDASILPPMTTEKLLATLQKVSNIYRKKYDNKISILIQKKHRETPFLSPYEIKSEDQYLSLLAKVVRNNLNKPAIPYFRSSVGDENLLALTGKTVLGIGPEGGNAHGPNEWVSLRSLQRLEKILYAFLESVDKAQIV